MRKSLWKNPSLWLGISVIVIFPTGVMRDIGVSWFVLPLGLAMLCFVVSRYFQRLEIEEEKEKLKEPLPKQERDAKLLLLFSCLWAFVALSFGYWLYVRPDNLRDIWSRFYALSFLYFFCFFFDIVWATWRLRQIRREMRAQSTAVPS